MKFKSSIKTPYMCFIRKLCFILTLFTLILSSNVNANPISIQTDSLSHLSYSELDKRFYATFQDSTTGLIYAKAYMKKAIEDGDSIRKAWYYYFLTKIYNGEKAIAFADSIIALTKDIEGHTSFPADGYQKKGLHYYRMGRFHEALDQYLLGLAIAKKNGNFLIEYQLKININLIKQNNNEDVDMLPIFRKYVNFLENSNDSVRNKNGYLTALYDLSKAYIVHGNFDSANYNIKKGIDKSILKRDTLILAWLTFMSGINHYSQENYRSTIDSAKSALRLSNMGNNFAYAHRIIGNCYIELKLRDSACIHYAIVDSFLIKTNSIFPPFLSIYPPLIKYYADKGDYKKQLYYTNNLIKFDSIVDDNQKDVAKKLAYNYDVPELLKSKDLLVKKLEQQKNRIWVILVAILISLITVFVIGYAYYVKKIQIYKTKFEQLMTTLSKDNEKIEKDKANLSEPHGKSQKTTESNGEIKISNEIVERIIEKLYEFEEKQRFTNQNCTLNSLAKELKTNNVYLSKVINDYKGLSFPNYLIQLRLDLALNKLQTIKQFRSYTIKAIAEEVGFKTAQSFSQSFQKKTGITPSFFIKELINN